MKKPTFDKIDFKSASLRFILRTCDNWEWCRKNQDHGPQRIHCQEGYMCKKKTDIKKRSITICWPDQCVPHIWIWAIYVKRVGQTCMSPLGPRSPANWSFSREWFRQWLVGLFNPRLLTNLPFIVAFCLNVHYFLSVCLFPFVFFFSKTCLEVYLVRVRPGKPTQPTE